MDHVWTVLWNILELPPPVGPTVPVIVMDIPIVLPDIPPVRAQIPSIGAEIPFVRANVVAVAGKPTRAGTAAPIPVQLPDIPMQVAPVRAAVSAVVANIAVILAAVTAIHAQIVAIVMEIVSVAGGAGRGNRRCGLLSLRSLRRHEQNGGAQSRVTDDVHLSLLLRVRVQVAFGLSWVEPVRRYGGVDGGIARAVKPTRFRDALSVD